MLNWPGPGAGDCRAGWRLASKSVAGDHARSLRPWSAICINPEAYVEADIDFHLALAEAVGNPLILSLLDSCRPAARAARAHL